MGVVYINNPDVYSIMLNALKSIKERTDELCFLQSSIEANSCSKEFMGTDGYKFVIIVDLKDGVFNNNIRMRFKNKSVDDRDDFTQKFYILNRLCGWGGIGKQDPVIYTDFKQWNYLLGQTGKPYPANIIKSNFSDRCYQVCISVEYILPDDTTEFRIYEFEFLLWGNVKFFDLGILKLNRIAKVYIRQFYVNRCERYSISYTKNSGNEYENINLKYNDKWYALYFVAGRLEGFDPAEVYTSFDQWNFLMNPKEYEELGMTGKKYVNDISVHDLGNCIQLNIRVNYIKLDENSKHLDVDRRYYEFKFIKANPSSSRLDITAICKSSTTRFEVLDDPQEASKRKD